MLLIASTCLKILDEQQLSWLNLPDPGAHDHTYREGFLLARSVFSGSVKYV
jgi:hypothetical protein